MKPEDANRFLPGFEGKILRPSAAYEQARSSYPYRISELVFGSLLAAYILGFVSVGISELTLSKAPTPTDVVEAATKIKTIGWPIVFNTFTYLAICCSFSFLTAALYSVYHNSILTMPNVRIADLTTDFSIAISQAVFFGISIIWPSSFLICLGGSLLLVLFRQQVKFKALARFFHERVGSMVGEQKAYREPEALAQYSEAFYDSFHKHLENARLGESWGKVGSGRYKQVGGLMLFGGLVVWLYWHRDLCSAMLNFFSLIKGAEFEAIRGMIYTVVGYFFIRRTWKILEKKSKALDDMGGNIIKQMDEPATKLANLVKDSILKIST